MLEISCKSSLTNEEIKMQRHNNSLVFHILFQESNINSINCFTPVNNWKGFQNARTIVWWKESQKEMRKKEGKIFSHIGVKFLYIHTYK